MKNSIKSNCILCEQYTNHLVLFESITTSGYQEYDDREEIKHQVLECCGCETKGFRKVTTYPDNSFQVSEDEWEVDTVIEYYPKKNQGSIKENVLPDVVESIYIETCNAYRDGAFTLAGIGFRATIEAICNDRNIIGKELSTRINGLVSQGLISKKDSSRLHAIRFMGNDAAHEIMKPSMRSLKTALIIVEHLLTTVYLLDKAFIGKHHAIIEDYEIFEKLLVDKIKLFKSEDELPLQEILGKDFRLTNGNIGSFEKKLAENIGRNNFNLMKFGVKKKVGRSRDDIQHYIIS